MKLEWLRCPKRVLLKTNIKARRVDCRPVGNLQRLSWLDRFRCFVLLAAGRFLIILIEIEVDIFVPGVRQITLKLVAVVPQKVCSLGAVRLYNNADTFVFCNERQADTSKLYRIQSDFHSRSIHSDEGLTDLVCNGAGISDGGWRQGHRSACARLYGRRR